MSENSEKFLNKTDVIVVGGGPAGISCAVTIARAGKKVVLIERGKFCGSKNVFGGAIYAEPVREIFPNFETNAPLERKNTEHRYAILGEEDATTVSYRNNDSNPVSYSVIRAKFDRWMADEAKKEGVIIVTETVVRELILEKERVIGVRTELENYYSDIVVLADGVNSLLAKQAGVRGEIDPHDVAVSVKEVLKLDNAKINERFNIGDKDGCIYEIFGGPMLNMLGLGFIYTNQNSISIGLGITMNELIKHKLRPYALLDKLKEHPAIAPLIKDAELTEYSAHLIPEGGYKKIPTLYASGVMVCGDAAMLVNNLHWEGTNLAMISGKLAGETAVIAVNKNDFSAKTLSKYQQSLEKSFVMKDMKTYKDLMGTMAMKNEQFLGYYPKKINSFFKMFTAVNCIPKRTMFRGFIKSVFKERGIFGLFSDGLSILKLLWSILR